MTNQREELFTDRPEGGGGERRRYITVDGLLVILVQ